MKASNWEGPVGKPLYAQGRGHYQRRKVVPIFLTGMAIFGAIGASAVIIRDLAADVSTQRALFLIPIILWMCIAELVLLVGQDLFPSQFFVWEGGFAPPVKRGSPGSARLPSYIPFNDVERIVGRTFASHGEERLYGVSVELSNGRRLLIRTNQVGAEGLTSLADAWRAFRKTHAAPPSVTRLAPKWVASEWRIETVTSILLGAIFVIGAFLLALAGDVSSLPGIEFSIILAIGLIFVVGWALAAWSRSRGIARTRLTQNQ